MNLNPIKANMTEVEIKPGVKILFSYKTPVAYHDFNNGVVYRTAKKWSATTTRHINQWLGGFGDEERPQEFFDNLLSEVK